MPCILIALLVLASAHGQAAGYRAGLLHERADLEAFVTPPSQEGVAEGFWRVGEDTRLFHFAEGDGQDVLFLHGGPGYPPAAALEGMQPLTDRLRVHYYHQRGCGQSTRPFDRFESPDFLANYGALVESLGIEQQICDIERIRRILGQDKLTLVGHSFGGFLATLYAIEFPQRVERLILVSPAEMLRMPVPGGGMFETIKRHLPEGEVRDEYDRYLMRFFSVFGTIFRMSEDELVALNGEFARFYVMALEAQNLPVAGASVQEGLDSGWMPFGVYFSLGMQYDHTAALSRITCPVLILHGGKDIAMSREALAPYELIENATVVVVPDAAHYAFTEQPDEFARLIRNWEDEQSSKQ